MEWDILRESLGRDTWGNLDFTYYTSAMSFFMDRSLRGEVMSLDSINGNQIVTGCDTLERIDK